MAQRQREKIMVTIGSDPEMMLMSKGNYRSAIGVVPGTKYKPHKVGKNLYYYDNVMAECTIQPASDKKEAVEYFRTAFRNYAKLVHPNTLVVQASQNYPVSELKHKDALAIGCDREACAYALMEMEPPEEAFVAGTLRSAGGHLHLGSSWIKKDPINCLSTIRMCDLFLGTMSIFLDKDATSKKRKELYGKAGRFRMPPHGAEYRSLSNFWLASPKLVGFIYDMAKFVLSFLEDGKHNQLWNIDTERLNSEDAWNEEDFTPASCHKCVGYDTNALRKAIDTMDKTKGTKFLSFIKDMLPANLYNDFETLASQRESYDFYKEWKLV